MHEMQYGSIRNLPIVGGEPVLQQAKVIRRRNLAKQSTVKPVNKNFYLKASHLQLLKLLDEIGDGVLDMISFREGLPCELEHSAA